MSKHESIDEVIENLIAFDEEPPSEEYWHYGYGNSLASHHGLSYLAELVLVAFMRLPGTIVSDLLHGVFDVKVPFTSSDRLIELLGKCRDINSASVIVELVKYYFGETDSTLGERLLPLLGEAVDRTRQDQLSYAIWVLCNLETIDLTTDTLTRASYRPPRDAVMKILARDDLTDYARGSLEACLPKDE